MNIFGKLLIKSEIVSNIKGDTDKRLAGLKTNDITLTDIQEYEEYNVVFAKFKINGDDGAEFGILLRTKKNRLVDSLYAISAIRMADEFVEHECWAVMTKFDSLGHHYLEAVKLPTHPTLLSRKEWMDSKFMEGEYSYRKNNLSGIGVTEEYFIKSQCEMRKVHATEFDAKQDLHRISGHDTYDLYGIVDSEPHFLGTWYGKTLIHLCYGLVEQQPLKHQIIDRMPSHFEYNGHPIFSDIVSATEYSDSLKMSRHEVWGVKPLSKSPVLLGVYEATSFEMAAEKCPLTHEYGFFKKMEYNGNPVFPSKYVAAQHIVERYDVKTEYAVYGYNPVMKCADYIGDGVGRTFDEAANHLFNRLNHQQPHITSNRTDLGSLGIFGKWRYYGHPLFHTKEQAESYGKNQEALDGILGMFSTLGTTNAAKDAREVIDRLNSGPWTIGFSVNMPKERKTPSMFEIWGINSDYNRTTLVTKCKADSYDSAIDYARTLGIISQDATYNGHPVFDTEESAENYLVKPRGFVFTVDSAKVNTIAHNLMPVQHLCSEMVSFTRIKKKQHKVQDLPYFSEVAQVIGTTDAAMELYKVLKCIKCHDDIMNEELDMAFTWHLSPQGDSFWAEVECRIQEQRAAEEQEILDGTEDESCKPQ